MIEIKNLHNIKPNEPYDVRVSRKSVLGNKFYMEDESQRNEVCDKYKDWFDKESMNPMNTQVQTELKRLETLYIKHGKLRLFCWCSPKRCHAETIRDYLIEMK